MSEAQVTLADPAGLHARQAARVVRLASRYDARVTVRYAGRTADARSLLELLTLGVGPGTQVTLAGEGPEADAALAALTLDLSSPAPEAGGDATTAPSSVSDR
jgi:phosphotransferase system HPr (HPr) family protein